MRSIDNNYDQVYHREKNLQATNSNSNDYHEHKGFPGMFVAETEPIDVLQRNPRQVHSFHEGHNPNLRETPSAVPNVESTASRILVLCDDFISRSALRDFLQSEGYEVTEKMFAEAFPHDKDEYYSGILVDMGTCRLSAESLIEFLREYFADVPVIVVDEQRQNDERIKRLKDFAFSYVVRPCNRKDLLSQIEYAVKFSKLLRENRMLKQSFSLPTYYTVNGHKLLFYFF